MWLRGKYIGGVHSVCNVFTANHRSISMINGLTIEIIVICDIGIRWRGSKFNWFRCTWTIVGSCECKIGWRKWHCLWCNSWLDIMHQISINWTSVVKLNFAFVGLTLLRNKSSVISHAGTPSTKVPTEMIGDNITVWHQLSDTVMVTLQTTQLDRLITFFSTLEFNHNR